MNVGQLRTILEHLPDALPVITPSGNGAKHLIEVRRGIDRVDWPGRVHLNSVCWRAPIWHEDMPADIQLHGPFRRRTHLEEQLGLR